MRHLETSAGDSLPVLENVKDAAGDVARYTYAEYLKFVHCLV